MPPLITLSSSAVSSRGCSLVAGVLTAVVIMGAPLVEFCFAMGGFQVVPEKRASMRPMAYLCGAGGGIGMLGVPPAI